MEKFIENEVFEDDCSDLATKILRQELKCNINTVLHKSTPVELEHVEIYFKPKEKYVKAFETLQQLFELMISVRYKKIHTEFFMGDYMFVENEDYFQAINVLTGELNLKQFLICMHNVIKKKHIKKYVSDEKLRAELLEALKNCKKWDSDFNNPEFYKVEYLSNVLINTIDKMNLTDHIIDKNGIAKIVVNIMQLGDEDYLRALGEVLGTFTEEITEVVYTDYRSEDVDYSPSIQERKYKVLEFKADYGSDPYLVIHDVRVPDYQEFDRNKSEEKNIPEKYIKKQSAIIPLVNMDVKYHVEIQVDLKEECQKPLSAMFEIANILEDAYENEELKEAGDYADTINRLIFNSLLYNYNITYQAIQNSPLLFWVKNFNRDYLVKKVFNRVENPDIRAAILYDDNNDYFDTICIDNLDTVYCNYIEDGKWIFQADYKVVNREALENFFTKVIDNIGDNVNEVMTIKEL